MEKRHQCSLVLLILVLCGCTTIGPGESVPYQVSPSGVSVSATKSMVGTPSASVNSSPTPLWTPTILPTETLKPATYYNFDYGINPLTGLPVDTPENLERRPVMVKVSNWPREGRPHAGLSNADIVFEYFIGHQMNRFLALFYGEDASAIGPVRSGRLVDAQLVNLYQGLLAYGNADPQVDEVLVAQLGERALAFKNLPCPPMCGTLTHSATGVFADSAAVTTYAIRQGVDNATPDLRGMYFQEESLPGDMSGVSLRVEYADFSIMEWRFDEEDGAYQLWMEAETDEGLDMALMTDRNNEKDIVFENVVVMYAEYIEYASTLHDVRIVNTQGYHPALLLRDGRLTYATWRVPEPDHPIIFETPEGDSLPFKPGRTWIVIVGNRSQTLQPEGGVWEIYFDLP